MFLEKLYLLIKLKSIFIIMVLGILLASCTPISIENQNQFRNQVLKIAEKKYFIHKEIKTAFFKLTTFSRLSNISTSTSQISKSLTSPHTNASNKPILIIYLEGDGHSYNTQTGQPTCDPTPYQPLGLQLALCDTRDNILYIARPGQYCSQEKSCDPKYWTTHRFSQEVIDSMNEIINTFKNQIYYSNNLENNSQNNLNTKIQLIGFSGGGGLAMLIAANRTDIHSIITIAGDLDHKTMSQYHYTQKLIHSLNPIDFAPILKHIPQYHFVGKNDRTVPIEIAKNYLKASRDNTNKKSHIAHISTVQLQIINASHQAGWVEKWPELIKKFD